MAEAEGVDILAVDDRAARTASRAWHDPACGTAPSRRSATPPRRCTATWWGAGSPRSRAARSSAWCSTSTTPCGAASSATTAWRASSSARAAPLGEAYVAFQDYARELSRRGVILAVCSKNDEANALEPFEKHPDMVLRRADIASFVANWSDKAGNIRAIAEELNIGLDSLVFIDDNPFERNLVRQELPMVAVPEVSDDPTGYPRRAGRRRLFRGPVGHR